MLGLCSIGNFRKVSGQHSLIHLWVCYWQRGDPLYCVYNWYTGVIICFSKVLQKKTKSISFGLEPPMHRSETNSSHTCIPRNSIYASRQILSRLVDIWENGARKNLLLVYDKRRSCV